MDNIIIKKVTVQKRKEEKWVESILNALTKDTDFNKWLDKENIIISNDVLLPHSVSLNRVVTTRINDKGKLSIVYKDNISVKDISDINGKPWNVDIFVGEKNNDSVIPRLVIEVKYNDITTHDTITYSKKAEYHKEIFPGLRYGLLIGEEKKTDNIYIPSKVVEYGNNFDFIYTIKKDYDSKELNTIVDLIKKYVESSRTLETYDGKGNQIKLIEKEIIINSKR